MKAYCFTIASPEYCFVEQVSDPPPRTLTQRRTFALCVNVSIQGQGIPIYLWDACNRPSVDDVTVMRATVRAKEHQPPSDPNDVLEMFVRSQVERQEGPS